jgi:hypothetical protein
MHTKKIKTQLAEFQTGNSERSFRDELNLNKHWFSPKMLPEAFLAFVLLWALGHKKFF